MSSNIRRRGMDGDFHGIIFKYSQAYRIKIHRAWMKTPLIASKGSPLTWQLFQNSPRHVSIWSALWIKTLLIVQMAASFHPIRTNCPSQLYFATMAPFFPTLAKQKDHSVVSRTRCAPFPISLLQNNRQSVRDHRTFSYTVYRSCLEQERILS